MTTEITRRRFVKIGAITLGALACGGVVVTVATQAPETQLPSTKIGDGMSKVLVVYGTKTGCTTGVAERIGAALAEAGATVEVQAAENAGDPSTYDAVVVGSGIRMSQWHEPVRTWVAQHADALKGLPTAFYLACLTLANEPEKIDEVRAYLDPVIEQTGIEPVALGTFAGWYEPKKFSFLERTILKAMKAPQGDFRDWDAIDAWARETADKLGVAA